MKNSKKSMLLLEYQELSTSMRVFMGFRLTILGFSITIIGILFTHIVGAQHYDKLILEVCLLFVVFALIKTMVSLTRHLIIYSLRLKEIESKFLKKGFWCKWGGYLKVNPQDSKTKTISTIVTIINLVVFIFILMSNILNFHTSQQNKTKVCIVILTVLLSLGFFYNFYEIYTNLNPNKHWKKIDDIWKKISE